MRTASDIVCPACACVCDDLKLTLTGDRVTRVEPPCPLADRWFREHSAAQRPVAEIAGQPAPLEHALARAADLLSAARRPLVYGLARSSTPGQRAAVALAEQLGAAIDTTASLCHGPSILAVQNVGESTCSLGEVRNRCDLVIFWGCNPGETHPRHAERYSVWPSGQFVPHGRAGRTVVFVGDAREAPDWRLDAAGSRPDLVIGLEPDGDFEAISALRMLIRGLPLDPALPCGAPADQLRDLAARMRNCRSGAVFFGLGLTGMAWDGSRPPSLLGHANVEALLRLVAELNGVTRFYARRMRMQGDVSGADSVLCWQTGFPFSVDFSRGYPRYGPGEYSANELLERGEADACLLVGAETVPAFSAVARRRLSAIPTIVLDYPAAAEPLSPQVRFTTAPYGLAARGTIYRMDEIPLPLAAPLPTDLPTDEDILRQLSALLRVQRP